MILPTTWQMLKRYPYLLPFLIAVLLLEAVDHVCRILSQSWAWLKGHLVADDETSRRLDLVDEELDRREHPCRACRLESCNQACLTLERWEMRHE